MSSVLTAKHWQIFLFLIFAIVISNFTIEGQPLLTGIIKSIGLLIIISWPLVLGIELYRYLPERIEMGNTLFIINGMFILLSITAIMVISNGQGMKFSGSGLMALPVFYFMFAYLHMQFFPGKILKSIESGRTASFVDYVGYGVLIWIWPLGIWFIQPKINKAVSEHFTVEEEK